MACFAARTASGARLPVPFGLVRCPVVASAGLGIIKLVSCYLLILYLLDLTLKYLGLFRLHFGVGLF